MSEKIDLADFETSDGLAVLHTHELIALVRAVRAAREVAAQYALGEVDHGALKRLSAALAPFTDSSDSAEVRSDD